MSIKYHLSKFFISKHWRDLGIVLCTMKGTVGLGGIRRIKYYQALPAGGFHRRCSLLKHFRAHAVPQGPHSRPLSPLSPSGGSELALTGWSATSIDIDCIQPDVEVLVLGAAKQWAQTITCDNSFIIWDMVHYSSNNCELYILAVLQ